MPYPKNQYGKYYTGDSYIILNVSKTLVMWRHLYIVCTLVVGRYVIVSDLLLNCSYCLSNDDVIVVLLKLDCTNALCVFYRRKSTKEGKNPGIFTSGSAPRLLRWDLRLVAVDWWKKNKIQSTVHPALFLVFWCAISIHLFIVRW